MQPLVLKWLASMKMTDFAKCKHHTMRITLPKYTFRKAFTISPAIKPNRALSMPCVECYDSPKKTPDGENARLQLAVLVMQSA